jgi:tRNA A-37 threonylcarbamoyl transferase component Bud32
MVQPDMLPSNDAVLDFCRAQIGPVNLTADRSWAHGVNLVLELADPHGDSWIVKAMARHSGYEREREALQRWAPALGDRAPVLAFHDDDLRLLAFRCLPGQIADGTPYELDPDVHRQAGELIRRLHDSEAPHSGADLRATLLGKVRRWVDRANAGGYLAATDAADVAFVEGIIGALGETIVDVVPTHGDNQPRNWLIDDGGVVRLIDFGLAGLEWWGHDLNRLRAQQWQARPDLRDAFYAGYGRRVTRDEESLLRARDAESALTTIFWAREYRDPEFEAQGQATLALMRTERHTGVVR